MGKEIFPLAKGLPTLTTIIKRSSTVKSLMCKETRLVGKTFSTMDAFKRPFSSVNFLVLSNTICLGASSPNFVGLTRPFSSENSLILNKYVCVTGGHLAFSPVLMASVTVKNSFTLLTVAQFLPGISGLWLNYHVGLEIIPNLHVGRAIPCCMDCAAFQKWGSHHIILKGFLSNVLLLVLLNVCSKIEFFPTCPTWICFLCPICSFLFSQMQNVSQDWDTYLTGLGLFRGQNGPWSPNLWDSFCRFTLFRRCLFILDSTPRTWKQTSDGEVLVNFLEGNDTITIVHLPHERSSPYNHVQDMKLESNWESSCSHQAQDIRTGCDPRWKACFTIHSSVNGFYQDHICQWLGTLCRSILNMSAPEYLAATSGWCSRNSKACMQV